MKSCLPSLFFIVSTAVLAILPMDARAGKPLPPVQEVIHCGLRPAKPGIVKKILSNHRLALEDGRIISLAGFFMPYEGFVQQKQLLFTVGKQVTPYPAMKNKDRFGALRAHIIVNGSGKPAKESLWLQAYLLAQGRGYVYFYPGVSSCAGALLPLEHKARKNRLGIWKEESSTIIYPATDRELLRREGRYSIVEGQVLTTGENSRWTYLNFGLDWSYDFTVRLRASVKKQLQSQGIKVEELKRKRVEIRGVIQSNRGPQIDVFDAQQIVILDQTGGI